MGATPGERIVASAGMPVMGIDSTGKAQHMAVSTTGVPSVGIDQTTPGTTNGVVVNSGSLTSQGYGANPTVTRPANATPYTAGDVVGGAITFTNMGPAAGGQIIINLAALEIDVAAVPSGMTSFRLYCYNVTPPSALADNAPWDLPAGDRASYIGYVDIGTPVDLGSTLYVQTDGAIAQKKLASASMFGYLVTNGGFTPAGNSEVYVPTLGSVGL